MVVDDATLYLIAAYVLVSTILQCLRLAALREIGRRLGAIRVGVDRVGELLEDDIEVELEEDEREYASTA